VNVRCLICIGLLCAGCIGSGCGEARTEEPVRLETPVTADVDLTKVDLSISATRLDADLKVWMVQAVVTNGSAGSLTVPYDGDRANLPALLVPPAYVQTDALRQGEWVDVSALGDRAAVSYAVRAGETVDLTMFLPFTVARGDVVRIRVAGLTSDRFTVGVNPASESELKQAD